MPQQPHNQSQHGQGQRNNQYRQRTSGPHGQRRQTGSQQMGGRQTGGQQMGSRGLTGQTGARGMQGQQTGMQSQQSQQGGMHGQPHTFDDHMTDELRIALEDFSELSHVAAWCATECASGGPELGICARICQDIAEIAALNEMLITRDSMFGPEVADMFLRVAAEGLPELRQHQQHHPHILETVATIERTMNSCGTLLEQVSQNTQMSGQQRGGQMGSQQTGGQMGGQRTRGQQRGGQTAGQQQSPQDMQGMTEQGQHGQGMSGQPTGSPGLSDR